MRDFEVLSKLEKTEDGQNVLVLSLIDYEHLPPSSKLFCIPFDNHQEKDDAQDFLDLVKTVYEKGLKGEKVFFGPIEDRSSFEEVTSYCKSVLD